MEIKKYNTNQIVILNIDNEIYFKGKDIALILGYKNTNDALIKHVEQEDKKNLNEMSSRIAITQNLDEKTIFINESGLYSLILRSKLESAKQFKRWVTSEVLPSIRKTGEYRLSRDEQDKKKIEKINEGINVLERLGVNLLSDRDRMFLGNQVKNLLMNERTLNQNNDVIEYPLTRRLLDFGINYNDKMKGKLMLAGKFLSKLYFQKYNKYPEKRNQYVDGALRSVNIYTNDDFDIMDKAIKRYFKIN